MTREITPKMILSSKETADFRKNVETRQSDHYFAIKKLKGKVDIFATSLVMTEAAITIMLDAQSEDDSVLTFSSRSDKIYPTSSDVEYNAESLSDFNSISAYRTNTESVFITDVGDLRDDILIDRTTNTAFELDKDQDRILDNNPVYCFSGDTPYMISFEKNSDGSLDTADITIIASKESGQFFINAIRYVPMPSVGLITLNSVKYDLGTSVLLHDSTSFPIVTTPTLSRTKARYLHFQQIETSSILMSMMTGGAASVDNMTIAVSRIIGEYNTYAAESYVGFALNTDKIIETFTFNMANEDESNSGITAYLYNNIAAFNTLSTSPADCTICTNNEEISVTPPEDGNMWILLKIETDGSSTPVLESVTLTLGE